MAEIQSLNLRIESDSSGAVQSIDNTTNSLNELGKKLDDVSSKAQNGGMKKIADSADNVVKSADSATGRISKMGEATRSSMTTTLSSLKNVGKGMLSVASTCAGGLGSSLKSLATSGFGKLKDKISGVVGKVTTLVGAFARIAKYRFIRFVIKEITAGFGASLKALYQWSNAVNGTFAKSIDSMYSGLQNLKNSLSTMVAPLLEAVAPAITALLEMLTNAVYKIGALFSALTGKTYTYKAVKQTYSYADALDSVGNSASSAAKAMKQLAGFDELNNLSSPSDSGSGGSSGSSSSPTYTTEAIPSWASDIANSSYLSGIFDVFKKSWETTGKKTVEKIKKAFKEVGKLGVDVFESIFEVFTNGTGQESLETIYRTFGNIADIVGTLAKKLDEAWLSNKNGTRIVQGIADGFNSILGFIENITQITKEWVDSLNLNPIVSAFADMSETIAPLLDSIGRIFESLYRDYLLPVGKWVVEEAAPESLGLLKVAAETCATAFEALGSVLEKLSPIIQPIIDLVGIVFKKITESGEETMGIIKGLIEEVSPMIDNIVETLTPVANVILTVLKPAFEMFSSTFFSQVPRLISFVASFAKTVISTINTVINIIKSVVEVVKGIFNTIIGIITLDGDRISEGIMGIGSGIMGIISGVWEGIKTFFGVVLDKIKWIWDGITAVPVNAITAIKNFVSSIFPSIGEKISSVWNGVKTATTNIWNGIKNAIKTPINAILSFIEGMANGVVKGLNTVIGALNKLNFSVPSWVPVFGGKSIGFNIGYIGTVSLPRFAEGGMPEQGTLALVGERVGDTEILGNIHGRTGVVGGGEVTDIENAVVSTGETEAALLREQNALLRQLIAKSGNVSFAPSASAGKWIQQSQAAYAKVVGV